MPFIYMDDCCFGPGAGTCRNGPVGMVRFLQQFETGSGNYTAERARLLGTPSVAELGDALQRLRAGEPGQPADAAPEP